MPRTSASTSTANSDVRYSAFGAEPGGRPPDQRECRARLSVARPKRGDLIRCCLTCHVDANARESQRNKAGTFLTIFFTISHDLAAPEVRITNREYESV